MSQIREIKDRMNGIQSTMKITKAMYMISSSKRSHRISFLISLTGRRSYRREEFTVEQGTVGG